MMINGEEDLVKIQELINRLLATLREYDIETGVTDPNVIVTAFLYIVVDMSKFCKIPMSAVHEIIKLLEPRHKPELRLVQ